MNISSIIIYTNNEVNLQNLADNVAKMEFCEVVAAQDNKIVATIQTDTLDQELNTFKTIQAMQGVSDVAMIYSYQDLDEQIEAANNNDIESIMQKIDDEPEIKNIKYGGHLKI
ncbi:MULTISPECIES: chaperone NapD [unclassified Campylobacter]|uniref:chaperone NapD n=1 Tax=unclassified Campylobacter TaxID=2593542 RepID=UPI0022E9D857|nr:MULTISPECIES: chaperone NapD [unclassified Campylobacter]MDA3056255.1 chaperone NapD [Campylobacter sp. CN_NA1]MDA3065613.1 chaperone NapD [Campylobacter sp. CN_NE4]MDA3068769.1 chaperone NapD [Campylobacter sp. CN_NE3]MDA3083066.1 chaperone NapD [Campylobacter sp. CN_EL2]MDA3084354.1 chaperone NapD [Campylobacter sp. CN_NE1]